MVARMGSIRDSIPPAPQLALLVWYPMHIIEHKIFHFNHLPSSIMTTNALSSKLDKIAPLIPRFAQYFCNSLKMLTSVLANLLPLSPQLIAF